MHCCTLPDKHLFHGMCLYQVMMTLHFLNDVANDAESAQKIKNYVIIASLKSETMDTLINRTPSLAMSTSVLKDLSGKLDIKRHSPSIFYVQHYIPIFILLTCSIQVISVYSQADGKHCES